MTALNIGESKSPRPLSSDQAHYTKAFSYYSSVGDYFEATNMWVDDAFSEKVVEKLFENLGGQTDDIKPLHVLGVGSGSGEIELGFLKKLLIKFPKIHTCVVDPSAHLLEEYQAKIKEHAPTITFDWQNKTFEDFLGNQKEHGNKYHFISACNSLYYVENLTVALQSLIDMLAPGGILFVMITSKNRGCGKIWRTFPGLDSENLLSDMSDRFAESSLPPSSSSSSPHHRDSGQIHDVLRQLEIPYHTDEYGLHYRITQCFDAEDNEAGNLLLDFITHTIGFRHAPRDLFREVLACIKEGCVQRGDDWLFQTTNVCFIIGKPGEDIINS